MAGQMIKVRTGRGDVGTSLLSSAMATSPAPRQSCAGVRAAIFGAVVTVAQSAHSEQRGAPRRSMRIACGHGAQRPVTEPPPSVAQPAQPPEDATRSVAGLVETGTCPDSSGQVHLALGTPLARQPTRTFPDLITRGPTGPDTD